MSRAWRSLIHLAALSIVAVGCMSSAQVDSTDVPATPTSLSQAAAKPVFVPTDIPAPTPPTTEQPTVVTAANGGTADPTAEPQSGDDAAPTVAATATPAPAVPSPTSPPQPTSPPPAAPTRAPAAPTPTPTSAPAPPTATATPAAACPNGQVLTGNTCACPVGTAKRASDGQCVRLCKQSDLTIANDCVCTGEFHDIGGQCVKRCKTTEVPDGLGGCTTPEPTP